MRSLARTWEVLRMQQLPHFNFIYGEITGNDCEAPQAVQHLREWSLDLISYPFTNSHRSDLAQRQGYVPYMGGTRAMSPRETAPMWGSQSDLAYDGGRSGNSMVPPIGWLEDYWMGRYYGFIEAPKTHAPAALTLKPSSGTPRGAAPYDGPGMPPNPRPLP